MTIIDRDLVRFPLPYEKFILVCHHNYILLNMQLSAIWFLHCRFFVKVLLKMEGKCSCKSTLTTFSHICNIARGYSRHISSTTPLNRHVVGPPFLFSLAAGGSDKCTTDSSVSSGSSELYGDHIFLWINAIEDGFWLWLTYTERILFSSLVCISKLNFFTPV